jgi:hypothetical protein
MSFKCCSKKPVIMIQGQQVTLRHVNVEQCSNVKDTEAIYVRGKNRRLENLHIRTKQFGIKLDQTAEVGDHILFMKDGSVVKHIRNTGSKEETTLQLLQLPAKYKAVENSQQLFLYSLAGVYVTQQKARCNTHKCRYK